MKRECPRCDLKYDDATSWTICPHNPLDVPFDAPYCQYHDLFNCHLCVIQYATKEQNKTSECDNSQTTPANGENIGNSQS